MMLKLSLKPAREIRAQRRRPRRNGDKAHRAWSLLNKANTRSARERHPAAGRGERRPPGGYYFPSH